MVDCRLDDAMVLHPAGGIIPPTGNRLRRISLQPLSVAALVSSDLFPKVTPMSRPRPLPRRQVPTVSGLETRSMLSAMPHHLHALANQATLAAHVMTGSVSGTLSYPLAQQTSATTGTELIQATGRTHATTVVVTGQDTYQETALNSKVNRDQLTNGSLTLTNSDGTTIAVTYSGGGISHSQGKQRFSETIHGTAVVNTGANAGLSYKFIGHTSGQTTSDTTGTIKLNYVMVR